MKNPLKGAWEQVAEEAAATVGDQFRRLYIEALWVKLLGDKRSITQIVQDSSEMRNLEQYLKDRFNE